MVDEFNRTNSDICLIGSKNIVFLLISPFVERFDQFWALRRMVPGQNWSNVVPGVMFRQMTFYFLFFHLKTCPKVSSPEFTRKIIDQFTAPAIDDFPDEFRWWNFGTRFLMKKKSHSSRHYTRTNFRRVLSRHHPSQCPKLVETLYKLWFQFKIKFLKINMKTSELVRLNSWSTNIFIVKNIF